MRHRRASLAVGLLSLAWVAAAAAQDSLKDAYAAILNGDYRRGSQAISQLIDDGKSTQQVARVDGWLKSYDQVIQSRDALRTQAYTWNVEHSQAAQKEGKIYLALSFAAQAVPYAADPETVAQESWLRDLRSSALSAAKKLADENHWSRAHAHYILLERINDKDEEARSLREQSARHLRLELLYDKDEDIQRRLEHVTPDLLRNTLRQIDDNYYRQADFRKMAQGALDNLLVLANASKLYESSSVFDGIANPVSREHFVGQIRKQRDQISDAKDFDADDLWDLFRTIAKINRDSCSLPESLLTVEFTESALGELDEFTAVIWPADAVEFDKMMVGNFSGVGIQLGTDEITNRLKVVTPLEDSPALRAGVQPDDLIVGVDGESTSGWTSDKAIREITGPEGTKVTLTLFRPRTGATHEFELVRSRIQIKTVRGVNRVDAAGDKWNYMLDPAAGVAYVRLTGFNPDSHEELRAALEDARRQGMKGLILDLRYNPGGLLDVAVETVSLFQRKGRVVSTRGRSENEQSLEVSGECEFSDLPLVVLVNDASASASEILAGALQDHERAAVLGERTFGKGSVQRVLALERGLQWSNSHPRARLKLTTALYFLPDGRSPHRAREADVWGVDPDWSVPLSPKEITRNLLHQQKAMIIHNEDENAAEIDEAARKEKLAALKGVDGDSEKDDEGLPPLLSDDDIELLRSDKIEAPEYDPQLETALLHLRVKLVAELPWPRLARKGEAEAAKQP